MKSNKIKLRLSKYGITTLLCVISVYANAQQNIVLKNVSDDIVYVYDGFEENSFKKDAGIGWNGTWKYTKGTKASFTKTGLSFTYKDYTALGGAIENVSTENTTIERALKDTYELHHTTFYTSFLIKKEDNASFTLKGYGQDMLRYGLKIGADGSVAIRNSNKWGVPSKPGVLKNNTTYLVVLYKRGAVQKVAVFEEGVKMPKNPSKIAWATESKSSTAVDLDKFQFDFSGANVTIDEFRLSTTFKSVTADVK